jgi:hypothetical protein
MSAPTFEQVKKSVICKTGSVLKGLKDKRVTLWLWFNEEPAMRNLIIDGAAGGETKIRHDVTFPLLTLHRGKDRRVHFSAGFFQKENIVYSGVLQIFRTKNR